MVDELVDGLEDLSQIKPDENSPFRRSKIPTPEPYKAASLAADAVVRRS